MTDIPVVNGAREIGTDVGLAPELKDCIVAAICTQVRVRRLILFGSRATGTFSTTSDIDLAVELEATSPPLLRSEIDECIPTLLRVDIVDLSKIPEQLRNEIITTGITLYEAT